MNGIAISYNAVECVIQKNNSSQLVRVMKDYDETTIKQ